MKFTISGPFWLEGKEGAMTYGDMTGSPTACEKAADRKLWQPPQIEDVSIDIATSKNPTNVETTSQTGLLKVSS